MVDGLDHDAVLADEEVVEEDRDADEVEVVGVLHDVMVEEDVLHEDDGQADQDAGRC